MWVRVSLLGFSYFEPLCLLVAVILLVMVFEFMSVRYYIVFEFEFV